MTPLLFSTIPVYWKYDQALQLYPTPDLIVVADEFQPYVAKNMSGCKVINPGSFLKNDFSFFLYQPYENSIEDCSVPSDEF